MSQLNVKSSKQVIRSEFLVLGQLPSILNISPDDRISGHSHRTSTGAFSMLILYSIFVTDVIIVGGNGYSLQWSKRNPALYLNW